jgi:hypothetical protein
LNASDKELQSRIHSALSAKRLAATAHEEHTIIHVKNGAISYESWCFRKAHDINMSPCVAFFLPIYLGQPSHMELPQEPLVYRVEHWRKQESSVDTSTSKRSSNPKLEPNPTTNTEKDPDEWKSGDYPMTAPKLPI